MANLPTHRWKNSTGLNMPQIAERLHARACRGYAELQQMKAMMKSSTGEVREAYKLVIHDISWHLTQDLFHWQNAMIGAITDLEYIECGEEDDRKVEPRGYCDGPTGAPYENFEQKGCNGASEG